MTYRIALLLLLCLTAVQAVASDPGIKIDLVVTRYSEFKLTEEQTRIMDEATKVSTACRVFRSLYGHWPSDVHELSTRTSGIDFAVFKEKIGFDEGPEALEITVYDSEGIRTVRATVGYPVSPETRALAQDPHFRIHVNVRVKSGGA